MKIKISLLFNFIFIGCIYAPNADIHRIFMCSWEFNGENSGEKYRKGRLSAICLKGQDGQISYQAVVHGSATQTFSEKEARILFNKYKKDYAKQSES